MEIASFSLKDAANINYETFLLGANSRSFYLFIFSENIFVPHSVRKDVFVRIEISKLTGISFQCLKALFTLAFDVICY